MTKFYMTWELKPEAIPGDPEDAAKLWLAQLDMIKDQFKKGITTDWGIFAGELRGYSVSGDTTEERLHALLLQWSPYVKFKVKTVLTVDQTIAAVKQSIE
ncbi:MAG: hypothetical protein NWF13_07320 [Candidatus Bathyarchaeota archaeon]|nr:hypothetical protein [Candidatus Bathyarchaeota archaeon]